MMVHHQELSSSEGYRVVLTAAAAAALERLSAEVRDSIHQVVVGIAHIIERAPQSSILWMSSADAAESFWFAIEGRLVRYTVNPILRVVSLLEVAPAPSAPAHS